MDWLIEIPFPNREYQIEKDGDFSIKKFASRDLQAHPDFIRDIVQQWVVAPFVAHKNAVYRVPAQDDTELVDYASTIFTTLFNKVRGIYIDGKLEEIRLEDVMPHVKDSFTDLVLNADKLDPLVKDFYLQGAFERSNQVDVKLFQLNKEQYIKQTTYYPKPDHKRLWNFIRKPYKIGSDISISPENWVLSDRLLESPFLIFLSRYASEIVLTVNEKDRNVALISFKDGC
ncbi:hypothetical protein [Brevibacillus brevis]|uniref:hypothetical protein n=1 Tax=Brevibacillus brevis TaxID=1393 RepID=UPI0007D8B5DC|nr:hypothetical protein [Brevibacillus brevis]